MNIEAEDKLNPRQGREIALRLRDPDAADRREIREVFEAERRRGWRSGRLIKVIR